MSMNIVATMVTKAVHIIMIVTNCQFPQHHGDVMFGMQFKFYVHYTHAYVPVTVVCYV